MIPPHTPPGPYGQAPAPPRPQAFDFVIASAHGRALLQLPPAPTPDAPPPGATRADAVWAAVHLAAAEPLVCALERWLGEALDPSPACLLAPAPDAETRLAATVHDAQLAPEGSRLLLPAAWLRAAPLPEALAPALDWDRLPCRVILDHLRPPGDTSALGVGDLLLLPASFASEWHARALPLGNTDLPPAQLRIDPSARLQACATPDPGDAPRLPDPQAWMLETLLPLELPLGVLLPEARSRDADLSTTPSLSGLDIGVFDAEGELLAVGRLMPIAQGWGLRLQEVPAAAIPEPASSWT